MKVANTYHRELSKLHRDSGQSTDGQGTPGHPLPQALPASSDVRVTLSAEARRLALHGPGDFDAGKVARLRSLIESGSLAVRSDRIAAKIVGNDLTD